MSPVENIFSALDYLKIFRIANSTLVGSTGPCEHRKFCGVILVTGEKTVLITKPVFSSHREAAEAMRDLVLMSVEFANGELRKAGVPPLKSKIQPRI